jgi:hypothetical protein
MSVPSDILDLIDRATREPADQGRWRGLVSKVQVLAESGNLPDASTVPLPACATWAIALSLVEPDDLDRLTEARRAALAFAERAMRSQAGPSMAVRTARLRDELQLASDDAWAEAARREPLVAWAFPAETAGAVDHEGAALLRRLAAPTERSGALSQLSAVAARPDAPQAALCALVLERLEDASGEARTLELRRVVARLAHRELATLLDGLLDARTGRDAAATLAGLFTDPAQARSVADALRVKVHARPLDVRALFREAWLEAAIDPVVALSEPRSAFAKLRSAFVAFSLVCAIGGSAISTAQAQDPGDGDTTAEHREDATERDHADPWSRDAPAPSNPWAR